MRRGYALLLLLTLTLSCGKIHENLYKNRRRLTGLVFKIFAELKKQSASQIGK